MFHALESAERLNMAERSQLFLTLIHFKQQKTTQIPFAACKLTPDALIAMVGLKVSGKLVVVEGAEGDFVGGR